MKSHTFSKGLHALIGGITTDYFDLFCNDCGEHINVLDFYGIDSVGVKLRSLCPKCNKEVKFKIKVHPPLGPIEIIANRYGKNRGYRLYHKQRLKKHLKQVGYRFF